MAAMAPGQSSCYSFGKGRVCVMTVYDVRVICRSQHVAVCALHHKDKMLLPWLHLPPATWVRLQRHCMQCNVGSAAVASSNTLLMTFTCGSLQCHSS
jgi:hypothetical protein